MRYFSLQLRVVLNKISNVHVFPVWLEKYPMHLPHLFNDTVPFRCGHGEESTFPRLVFCTLAPGKYWNSNALLRFFPVSLRLSWLGPSKPRLTGLFTGRLWRRLCESSRFISVHQLHIACTFVQTRTGIV